ncbi:MAG TPA: transporter substrate-binding domain-containing protein [Chloroflexi bacterium]|nr:transporter substrate-binding domain-containing protein [Chloroflexota bacterium]
MSRPRLFTLLAGAIALCGALVACGASPDATTPVATATAFPTMTPPPSARGAMETPVPSPVSESALEDIRQRGEIRVGVLYNYPPFCYLADNGQVQGYEPALVQRIGERWGVEVTFVQVTRQTRLPMLIDGEVDMLAAAMPHRRELEQFVEFSDTTFRSGYVILVRSDSGIDSLAALSGRTVAVAGEEAGELLEARAAGEGISPSVQIFDTFDDAAFAFTELNMDALVGRRENLMLFSSSQDNAEIINEFVAVEPYAFAVRRGDTPLRDLLNLTLQRIAVDEEYGEIFLANFYGYAADIFPTFPGEPAYTFETFPTDINREESVVARIQRGEPLRVAGMELSPEPAVFDSQPILDGYNRAIINEMARRWNVPVVETPDSVGEVGIGLLTAGEVDLVVGVRPDQSLIGRVAFSQPYYRKGLRLIYMQASPVLGVADLELKPSMIVEPLDISRSIIEDNNAIPRIQEAGSFDEAFQALLSLSVQAVVGDEYALMLMQQTDDRIGVVETRYRPADYVMALPVADTDFQALVSFTLQDMKADGTLDALREQYFGPYLPEGQSLEPLPMDIWPGESYLRVGG